MNFFRIKNYEKYQGTRTGDGKPWIKLHKKLRHDWAYGQLHDSHKAAFVHLLLTADEVNNRFPCDSRALRKQLVLNSNVKIEVFEKVGLIEIIVDPSQTKKLPRIDKNRLDKIRIDKRERKKTSLDTYHDLFFEKFKSKPMINGKHGIIMAGLEKKMGRDEIMDLLARYFQSDDKFIITSGYTVEVFSSQINKLIASKNKQPEKSKLQKDLEELKVVSDEWINESDMNGNKGLIS